MSNYSIRFAEKKDIPAIMEFINLYWKRGHILATDRDLFEWQYVNNEKVNMVIGMDDNNDIQAILGYIPYDDTTEKDFSLALWKARPGTAFLGVKLLMFLLREEPHRHMFCNGINAGTSDAIYHRLGIDTGKLSQWYRLGREEQFVIAEIREKSIPKSSFKSNLKLEKVHDFSELEHFATTKLFNKDEIPYKSKNYIKKRYFNHPAYEYLIYCVKKEDLTSDSAIVFRVQECNNSRALRLIDFIGKKEDLYLITNQIDKILADVGAEYVDMYEHGLDAEQLYKAGWIKVGDNENIIPNYFSPYEKRNIEINISMSDKKITLFKGDGDQDRPN